MNYLFDFYQSLLTDKQKSYMALYYIEDYSLGEISENYGVSRQAIYDNIKRTEAILEDYEAKLRLYERHLKRNDMLKHMKEALVNEEYARLEQLMDDLLNFEN